MRRAIVTGASSGIGKELTSLLRKRGWEVIGVGRNEKALEGEHLVCDLRSDRKSLIALIRKEAPDLLINAAGLGLYGPALSHPTSDQMEIVEVNVDALVEITIEAAKALVEKRKRGTILNVSSAGAFYVMPNMATYSASKAFVNNFSQALDEELKRKGIRILASCPGQVETDFRRRASGGHSRKRTGGAMSVTFAAKEILKQIEEGRGVYLFDGRYRWLRRLTRLLPEAWVRKGIRDSITSLHEI